MKNRIRTIALATGVAAVALLGAAGSAQAQVGWSVGINSPGVSVGFTNAAPVRYYQPRYYAAPRVVYSAPAPVYYTQPAPVYYTEAAPVYYETAYAPSVVYPASYYVGWRQGYVRYNNRWVHPSYVRGYSHGNDHDHGHR